MKKLTSRFISAVLTASMLLTSICANTPPLTVSAAEDTQAITVLAETAAQAETYSFVPTDSVLDGELLLDNSAVSVAAMQPLTYAANNSTVTIEDKSYSSHLISTSVDTPLTVADSTNSSISSAKTNYRLVMKITAKKNVSVRIDYKVSSNNKYLAFLNNYNETNKAADAVYSVTTSTSAVSEAHTLEMTSGEEIILAGQGTNPWVYGIYATVQTETDGSTETTTEGSTETTTETPTLQISNAEELLAFANRVNSGETALNAVLLNDITLNEGTVDAAATGMTAWTPIGNSSNNYYTGIFDGQGYTISGLYFNDTTVGYAGLFGYTSGAQIKNVSITNSYINAAQYTGSICGYNSGGTISNCFNTGSVSTSNDRAGGICGYISGGGTISGCFNTGSVSAGGDYAGGICGYISNSGTISGCGNDGAVNASNRAGGICGNVSGTTAISNCFSTGSTTATASYAGGICGYASGSSTISSCSDTGLISAASYAGGICGRQGGTISSCCYLSTAADIGIGDSSSGSSGSAEPKTAEQYASGEVCYLLNGSVSGGEPWYQTINTDTAPTLDSTHGRVYITGIQYCPGNIAMNGYSNSDNGVEVIGLEHSYNEKGLCTSCGDNQPAVYNEETGNYEIGNYGQLLWFAAKVNGGETAINAVLTANIAANDGELTAESTPTYTWTPIGNSTNKYAGIFDGQGHTVSGLYFNDTNTSNVGLFGYTSSAQIKNVSLAGSYINAYRYVGGICGYSYGSTISNCSNDGIVSASSYVGGICGYNTNYGTISSCSDTGSVSASGSYAGGICGYKYSGTISDCYYLSSSAGSGIGSGSGSAVAKTAEQYASGEVCYLLNGSVSGGETWYQTINTDVAPTLDGTHSRVYSVSTQYCPNKVETSGYSNSNDGTVIINPDHPYDEKGFCTVCKENQPASYNDMTGSYEIGNYGQLLWFAAKVNGGETSINAVLTADITANDGEMTAESTPTYTWTPIGKNSTYKYAGIFDGQGHTINGLYYSNTGVSYVGLFGYITNGAQIKDVSIASSYINAYEYVGGICGYSSGGAISGCFNTSTVNSGYYYAGGICGYNKSGTISLCQNSGSVSTSNSSYAGGICGYSYGGTISDCCNIGSVSTGGASYAGGICGYNSSGVKISSCSNSGSISASSYASGICGRNYSGTIENCYYLSGTATSTSGTGSTTGTERTAEQYASGEVCYLLNGSVAGGKTWYQTIGEDAVPTLDSTHSIVYIIGRQYCPSIIELDGYSNSTEGYIVDNEDHPYDGKGFCTVCEAKQPAVYNKTTGSYEISNYGQLLWFAAKVNGGENAINGTLTADIIANDGELTADSTPAYTWTPIGSNDNRYIGVFDGQGHTISGLYYKETSVSYAGLFGCVDSAQISSVSLADSYIRADRYVGGICGCSYGGAISGCSNTSSITGYNYVGGICGYNTNSGSISTCSNAGSVSSTSIDNSEICIGGICGRSYSGTISDCCNTGSVTLAITAYSYNCYAGGICGYNYGTISSCSNTGIISEESSSESGGGGYTRSICGYNYGTISNCYYLSGTAAAGGGTEKTAEQYASGEVCYLLNGSVSGGETWRQTLDVDAAPTLDSTGDRVYITGTQFCPGRIMGIAYNNTGGSLTVRNEDHVYDTKGICNYCKGPQPAVYNKETNNYEISSYGQLLWFAEQVNSGSYSIHGVLMADITANDGEMTAESSATYTWTPIGNSTYSYAGVFDGQGHTVSGLYFNDTSASYVGLFGYTGSAQIKNVSLAKSYLNAYDDVGGICGYNYNGTISSCSNTSSINASSNYAGGICGSNGGTVSDCTNMGNINASNYNAGGICGSNGSTVSGCSNSGSVSAGYRAGGICGYNSDYDTISSCTNTGSVSVNGSSDYSSCYAGGICGYSDYNCAISNCSNSGSVSSVSSGYYAYAGGICGSNNYSSTISGCSNTGSVSAESSDYDSYIGGICASNNNGGSISLCYYLSGTAESGIGTDSSSETMAKTAEQYASGEVCYLLNGSVSGGEPWYQTLDNDTAPVLDSTHSRIYTTLGQLCPEYSELTGYNNSGDTVVTVHEDHTYGSDNKCIYCGTAKVAAPVFNQTLNAYEISDRGELLWFVSYVNSGNTATNAVLTADITVNEGAVSAESTADQWTPIGTYRAPYIGSFDGQGYTISGLYLNDTSAAYIGLFGAVGDGGSIKNLNVENSYFCGTDYVGAICGSNSGSVERCSVTAVLNASTSYVGAICGTNNGSISYCSSENSQVSTDGVSAGGVCGSNSGSISYCYNKGGSVSANGANSFMAGGICGDNSGTVNSCYNTASVSVSDTGFYCGSVCGDNTGTIANCYYLSGSSSTGIESGEGEAVERDAAQFASGEVCYLLNNAKTENVAFYQSIGTDTTPSLKKARGVVYSTGSGYTNNYVKGDVDGSETLDKADAAIILKYISGIITEDRFSSDYNSALADYNGDNAIDMKDVIAILNAIA